MIHEQRRPEHFIKNTCFQWFKTCFNYFSLVTGKSSPPNLMKTSPTEMFGADGILRSGLQYPPVQQVKTFFFPKPRFVQQRVYNL